MEQFYDIDPQMLKILEGMLQFNPYMRLSANECLKQNMSQNINNLVDHNMTAPYKIHLEIDKDDAFDYKHGRSDKFKNSDYL